MQSCFSENGALFITLARGAFPKGRQVPKPWGYIDPEEGLMPEVIAAGLKTDDGFRFAD